MKFAVNDNCISCGLCEQLCPQVFELKHHKAEAIEGDVPEECVDDAVGAMDSCPVEAIEEV